MTANRPDYTSNNASRRHKQFFFNRHDHSALDFGHKRQNGLE